MALTKTQVSELYVSILGRASEGEGNTYWQTNQDNMAKTANVMLGTDAAKDYFGSTLDSNGDFIQHIYINTLGKTIVQDYAGIAYWVGQLDSGKSKGEVVAALIGAAQDPQNAGTAQDRFNNKVAVSDYASDTLFHFTDMATFTNFIVDVDESALSVLVAKASVDAMNSGKNFTLTGSVDLFYGTSSNDTFVAASGTLGLTDSLIDTNSKDKDVLNLSLAKSMDGVNEPVIQKIETINVTYDHLSGAATAFDATNVVGASINMLSGRAIDKTATVVDAGINNVIAGAGIDTLVVTNVTNGEIQTGAASNLIVDDAEAESNLISITVNKDLNLGATTGAASGLTINAMAYVEVDLDSTLAGSSSFFDGTSIIFGGDFSVTVKSAEILDGLTIINQIEDGNLIADIGAKVSVDADGWSFDKLILSSNLSLAGAATLSVKNNQNIFLNMAQTATTILENEDKTISANINVTTGENHTLLVFDSANGTSSETIVNLRVTSNLVLGTVTDTGTAGELVLTGFGSVTIGSSDFAYFDASSLGGSLDITAAGDCYVTGSATMGNSIDVSTFDVIFQGGAGADTVDARTAETSTIITALDSGNDTLLIDDTLAQAKVTVDFGAGIDTLWLGNATELSGVAVGKLAPGTASIHSWENLEKIELQNVSDGVDTLQVTVNGSDISGKTIEIFTNDAEDTAEFGIYADNRTMDLSTLKLTNIDAVFIKGGGEKGAIIQSTIYDDIIDTGNGNIAAKMTIVTGAGDDTIVIDHLSSGVSVKDLFDGSAIITITDYAAEMATSDNDTLDLPGVLSVLGNISEIDALSVAGATTETETGSLNAVVTNGILTLVGATVDKANMNTITEWVAAASLALDRDDGTETNYDVVAFEFNGNTYVVTHDDTGGASGDATIDNVIELAGLTGITGVSGTPGDNTVLIV